MARPLIMVSVYLVYIMGTLAARAAGAPFDMARFLSGGLLLTLVVVAIHYANEYADYETDALTWRTPYSGGSGVLPGGRVPRSLALRAAQISLATGMIAALAATILGQLSLLALVLLSIGAAGGWMYSLPPLRLAWHGWGEADNALLGGMVLPLYGYVVQGGRLEPRIALAFLPFTLLAFNNLLATTWADRDADRIVGKYTLATRRTTRQLRRLYALVATGCFALVLFGLGNRLPMAVQSTWLTLPLVFWGWRTYTRIDSPHPSVWAMVVAQLVQIAGWWLAGNG
ncbi:MAG: prenyltransferase [Anaerolineae bacterium]|nr:prenyltransferase [Anaerolineae bacterium]